MSFKYVTSESRMNFSSNIYALLNQVQATLVVLLRPGTVPGTPQFFAESLSIMVKEELDNIFSKSAEPGAYRVSYDTRN